MSPGQQQPRSVVSSGSGPVAGRGRPTPTRRGGATRLRLIDAASELLSRGGVDAVTLRGVGHVAGVSRSAPYRHFQDKEDLLLAVARRGLVEFRDEMATAMVEDEPAPGLPSTRLHRACVAYVRVALDRPRHYRLMFGGRTEQGDHAGRAATAQSPEYGGSGQAFFLDAIAAAQRDRLIRPGDPKELATLIWALLHGIVELTLAGHLSTGEPVDATATVPRLIGDMLAGLAPAGDPASR